MTDRNLLYNVWLENTASCPEVYDELLSVQGMDGEIGDRFYRELEFGTGGLRGVIGAGTNRMNIFTVGKATQGYADYLNREFPSPSVAIAYDSRINSALFARTAAGVFAANGIRVHIYPRLMPTPSLSFAVRELGCSGGIVITASHNPAKYNGYKVYGPDGCQITSEAARAIQKAIGSVDCFSQVKKTDFDSGLASGIISYIGEDTVERYIAAVSSMSLLPEGVDKNMSLVYTPLNGAGISCVPRCLSENGFTDIVIPPAQREPDGRFPSCPYPNPEIREALSVGLETARRTGCDLLIATDPDCDRVGAAVRDGEDYTLISGNEMGVLLLDYVCSMRISQNRMPERPVAVKTVVTTPMAQRVAEYYGVELRNVLTGFKYIGEQIGLLERDGEAQRYIFGFEESYGYLSGSFVRDKDAVNASLLICEAFAWHRSQGRTLLQTLEGLYRRFGYYRSKLLTFTFEGEEGFRHMCSLMAAAREKAPACFAEDKVNRTVDYMSPDTGLPASDVLEFITDSGAVTVRPSGTEPKLKVYLNAVGSSPEDSERRISVWEDYCRQWIR